MAAVSGAADFDGSQPLTCKILKPETNIEPVYAVDFAKKDVRSPFRTALTAAWSALIDRKTGAMTVALADSQRAYGAFGQCKVTGAS